jgi:peptide/nickel transport system permease protein
MGGFATTRLASAAVVVAGVVTLVFFLIHLVPGDPVEVILGESARPGDREALRHALGLDRPLLAQWLSYVGQLGRLDFGHSLYSNRPIAGMLVERLPATAMLATAALVVAVALAIPLGIAAAVHRDSWIDRTAMAFAALGLAIPNFCLGPLLIVVFSIQLGVTPVTGDVGLRGLILPALTLGTGLAAALARMIRASLLTSLGQNFVRTARAKGLTEARVILRHALGNALLPVVTVFGMQLGALLGGAVITEIVFAWPGIGLLTIESIQRRDYPTVQACVLVIALGYVAVNTLTDLVYAWLDPRIRLS